MAGKLLLSSPTKYPQVMKNSPDNIPNSWIFAIFICNTTLCSINSAKMHCKYYVDIFQKDLVKIDLARTFHKLTKKYFSPEQGLEPWTVRLKA